MLQILSENSENDAQELSKIQSRNIELVGAHMRCTAGSTVLICKVIRGPRFICGAVALSADPVRVLTVFGCTALSAPVTVLELIKVWTGPPSDSTEPTAD